jgi:hypothetical protein
MHINKQINNIFYTLKRINRDSPTNILYNKSGSLFDATIFSSIEHSLIPVLVTENNKFIDNSFYSALWLNDIIDFSQKIQYYANYYTNFILAIHSGPPSIFKREDLIILKRNINQYNFLSFCEDKNVWPMDNIESIRYGVVPPSDIKNFNNREKDILILNFKKQKQSDILYQYIKQKFPLTDIIHDYNLDISIMHQKMAKYKICIDIDNYYNLLIANSCGCLGITSLESRDENIVSVQNSNKIFDILPKLLKNTNHTDVYNMTINKYDWTAFCQKIADYSKQIFNKGFTI